MSLIVFLGPSVAREEAGQLLAGTGVEVQLQPPCRMGDVFVAAERRPRAIAIIDGYFEQTPAVWHKEILYALTQGIAVFGGASMGALRAAELHGFGMRGVGEIFNDYTSGALEDDDEVAVAHLPAEAGYLCRSDAMVNIRYGLRLAEEAGVIGAEAHRLLLESAKREHYPQRSWQSLYRLAPQLGVPAAELEALREFIGAQQPDLKREDAIATLRTAADWCGQGIAPEAPEFRFEATLFWDHLRSYFASEHTTDERSGVSRERLVQHLRLVGPGREQLRQRALLLFLVEQEARRLGLPETEARSALARFRRERGLASSQQLSEWMASQSVDRDECLALAILEDRMRALERRYTEQLNRHLPRVLKLEGNYHRALQRVEDKWRYLRDIGIEAPSDDDVDSTDAVLEWYQRSFGDIPGGDLEQHIVELGFGSPRQFLSELIAEYLHLRSTADEH